MLRARIWGGLALGMVIAAAVCLRPSAPAEQVNAGLWLWLAGGIALSLAFRASPAQLTLHPDTSQFSVVPFNQPRVRWRLVALGTAALLLLAEINGRKLPITPLLNVSYHLQFALLVIGCALLAIGFYGVPFPRRGLSSRWPVLAVTLLSFAVNTWRLGDAVHIWIDEFHFADAVVRLWHNPSHLLLPPNPGIAAFTSLYPYLQSLSVSIFGPDLVGLRMVSVVFGTLTIPALFLLAKTLFDLKTALLAALFLALFPPHIHFSRLGLNNIADPFFGVLALAFLARGFKGGRRGNYALAGVMLGLTQYFYEGGKLLYPLLAITWAGCMLVMGRPEGARRGLLATGFAVTVTAFPVYYAALASGAPALPRMAEMNIIESYFSPQRVANLLDFIDKSLKPPLLHLVHLPDESRFFYGGDTGLLLSYLAPALMLGVFVALWRLRLAGALPLLWLAATLLGNSLIVQSTWSARFVVVFPALALLTAVGLRWTFRLLWPQSLLASRRAWLTVTAAALLFALPQIVYYFGPHLDRYNQQVRIYLDHIDVFYRSRPLSPSTQIYVIHGDQNVVYTPHYDTLAVFWNSPTRINVLAANAVSDDLLDALPPSADYAFFVEPGDAITLALLSAHFDLLPPQRSPFNAPANRQYVLYEAPATTSP